MIYDREQAAQILRTTPYNLISLPGNYWTTQSGLTSLMLAFGLQEGTIKVIKTNNGIEESGFSSPALDFKAYQKFCGEVAGSDNIISPIESLAYNNQEVEKVLKAQGL